MKLHEIISESSEAENLKLVSQNGFNILQIHSPSNAVKLAAVTQNPYIILQISDPDQQTIAAAYAKADKDLKLILKSRFPDQSQVPTVKTAPKHTLTYSIWVINHNIDAGEGLEITVNADSWENAKKEALTIYKEDFEDDEDITDADFNGTEFTLDNISGISANNLNQLLADDTLIKDDQPFERFYTKFVKDKFKDNSVLLNKWTRYAKNVRALS
jgi:hypothetical protein